MAKHILFTTALNGVRFEIQVLPGQGIERELERKLEDLKITGDLAAMSRMQMGTVFITSDFTFPEDGHLHINKFTGLFLGEKVHALLTGMDEKVKEELDYLIDYMIEAPEYGIDAAKKYAKEFEVYGYTCDWDAKIAPKPTGGAGLPAGANIKRTIAASYPCPKEADCGFHIDPDLWFLLVRNVLRNVNTLIVGPTGCGKTEILRHLAKAMERELFIQDMGTVQDAQSALIGVHRLNHEGHSEFDPAPFVEYVKSGGIVLCDELNRAPLAANNLLFPCFDDRRYLPIDLASAGEERKAEVHADTVFFGTANLGSEYSGTSSLDRALLDRFFIIELDYLSEAAEIKVLQHRTGCDLKPATAIVKASNKIREQYRAQELSNAVSVRHTLQTAALVADGFDLDKALNAVVMPLFEDSVGVSERSKVKAIVSAF